MSPLLILFILFNLITFSVFALDKYCAIKEKSRYSEKSLHTISLLGGFVGAWLAMILVRHKIKKRNFMIIELLIGLVWILCLIEYYYYTQGTTCFICQVF